MVKTPRDRNKIIANLLIEAKVGKTTYKLMTPTKLNQAACERYVQALVKAKFMEECVISGKTEYRTTQDGIEFLRCLKETQIGLEKFYQYW